MSVVQEVLSNENINVSGVIVADKIPLIKTFSPPLITGRYKSGLIFMLKGKCVYQYDAESFEVNAGDLVYVPVGANYKCTHLTYPKDTRYYVVDFNLVDPNGKLINLSPHPIRFDTGDNEYIKKLFEKINNVYNVYEFSNHLILKSAVMEMLYAISKVCNASEVGNLRYDEIKKALKFVETHYRENTSSEELAKMFNMSYSHFRRLFVRAAGYPPTLYRNRIRIQKAYEMLTNGNMSVKEISDAVGFCDVYYFSTIFKKIVGISPGKVRK